MLKRCSDDEKCSVFVSFYDVIFTYYLRVLFYKLGPESHIVIGTYGIFQRFNNIIIDECIKENRSENKGRYVDALN